MAAGLAPNNLGPRFPGSVPGIRRVDAKLASRLAGNPGDAGAAAMLFAQIAGFCSGAGKADVDGWSRTAAGSGPVPEASDRAAAAHGPSLNVGRSSVLRCARLERPSTRCPMVRVGWVVSPRRHVCASALPQQPLPGR